MIWFIRITLSSTACALVPNVACDKRSLTRSPRLALPQHGVLHALPATHPQKRIRTPWLDTYFVYTSSLGTHTFFMTLLPALYFFGYPETGRGYVEPCISYRRLQYADNQQYPSPIICQCSPRFAWIIRLCHEHWRTIFRIVQVLAAGVYFCSLVKDLICCPRPFAPPVTRLSKPCSPLSFPEIRLGCQIGRSVDIWEPRGYLQATTFTRIPSGICVSLCWGMFYPISPGCSISGVLRWAFTQFFSTLSFLRFLLSEHISDSRYALSEPHTALTRSPSLRL